MEEKKAKEDQGVRGRRPILMGRSNDLFGFTLCPTWASVKKSARPFAQLGQAPKSQHNHLPNLGKHQKIQFAICPTWASTKKTDLPFAQLGQAPKKPIRHLHRRCKHFLCFE